MQAWKFLCSIHHVPMANNGEKPITASNSERRRWLQNKAVIVNGERPDWNDEIHFPITQLVFFPSSTNKRCTLV